MAIYHLTAKIISRGKGQSAIAAAAYRSGERLYDEQAAVLKYYPSREERIVFTDIMAPKDAPEWAHDRDQLWNHAERAERRKDAQLAREIEVALPHELTDRQREWLVKDFVREQFVRKGYAVDIAIHAPDRDSDERNNHAHLMVTMRRLGAEGFSATKESDAERRAMRNAGWTREKELGQWREQWAHLANRHLERHGHEARIDHRSLKEQGIDREPTVHLGYAANEMTQRGAPSDRMAALNEILARNELRFDLKAIDAELAGLEKQAAEERRQQTAQARREGADSGQHRALIAAAAARRREQGWSQIGRSQAHVPTPVAARTAQPDRSKAGQEKVAARMATEEKRADDPQRQPVQPAQTQAPAPTQAAGQAQQRQEAAQAAAKPAERPASEPTVTTPPRQQPKPAEQAQSREGWRWSEAWGWEKIEDSVQARAGAAAKADAAKSPAPAPGQEKAAQPASPQNQAPKVLGYGTSFAQTPLQRSAAQEAARQREITNLPDNRSHRTSQYSAGQGGTVPPVPAWQAPNIRQAGREAARSSFRVADRATGAVSSLADFASNLLSGPSAPPPEQANRISMRTLATDPEARKQYQLAQHQEAKRRGLAVEVIDDIRRDIEAGRDLKAEDVSKLTREHLEQIASKGDAYVREMIDASRKRADEYWKGRERERD